MYYISLYYITSRYIISIFYISRFRALSVGKITEVKIDLYSYLLSSLIELNAFQRRRINISDYLSRQYKSKINKLEM